MRLRFFFIRNNPADKADQIAQQRQKKYGHADIEQRVRHGDVNADIGAEPGVVAVSGVTGEDHQIDKFDVPAEDEQHDHTPGQVEHGVRQCHLLGDAAAGERGQPKGDGGSDVFTEHQPDRGLITDRADLRQ